MVSHQYVVDYFDHLGTSYLSRQNTTIGGIWQCQSTTTTTTQN
jgi:hypothetical protein